MSICAHTLVRNEERYVWFSVMSVINYVDKVLLWDMESTDATFEICKELENRFPEKISFKLIDKVEPKDFSLVRQKMLEATSADWVVIVDGDEVWWDEAIAKVREIINDSKESNLESIVGEYINLVGDIFHHQDKSAGKYRIKDKTGFVTIRAMNKNAIKGLHFAKPHGQQGIYDGNNKLIQDRDETKMYFLDNPTFMHFTNLPRSGNRENDLKVPKRGFKLKYELGKNFPLDYYYPEALFKEKPSIVSSPWSVRSREYIFKASLQTPLKLIKRKLYSAKSGY